MLPDLQAALPALSRRVDVWDGVSVWSLVLLFVFEVSAVLAEGRERLKGRLEKIGLVALGVLAVADYNVHRYRAVENGILLRKQAAFERLVSDQSASVAALQYQVKGANATASAAAAGNASLLRVVSSQARQILMEERRLQKEGARVKRLRTLAGQRWVDEQPFLDALKGKPKPSGVMISYAEDGDSQQLAWQIAGLLFEAGWHVYVPTPIRRERASPSYLSAAQTLGGSTSGVSIVGERNDIWRPPPHDLKTPYDTLWNAFAEAAFPEIHGGRDDSLPVGVLRIVVGPKEPALEP
jgi:hypothetical protein